MDGFDIVSGCPRDPMHLLYLGVNKKLLSFWVKKSTLNKAGKLPQDTISKVNCALKEVSLCYPSDFNRRPTFIQDNQNWKATQHRSFLLYTSLVVLIDFIDTSILDHFKLFSISVFLLSSCEHNHLIRVAENLLKLFVKKL